MHDLIIVGGSAAGVAAAIYAARRNLDFVMLTGDIGGEVATSGEIENYPGFTHTDGIALTEKFKEQLAYQKVQVVEPVFVSRVEPMGGNFIVTGKQGSDEKTWEAKSVIIATGIHPKPLPVPEEKQFRGKGLTYCTTCDGPLYKGKTVATIGGGNSALESALFLAEICPKVYVINKNPQFKGEQVLIDKVTANPKIEVIDSAMTTHALGEASVTGLTYTQNGEEKTLDGVQGIFVHIGNLPNSDLAPEQVTKNAFKEIVVDKACATNVPGLYAAGDVTDVAFKQIAIATGQGVTAALSVVSYLNALK